VEPDLVKNETKIIDFLRTEDMDAVKAVTRLCLYWKYRRQMFGSDRWLRKMTQTGHGALSSDDVAMLRAGYTAVVTKPSGGSLVLVDLSRLSAFSNDANTRIHFYFATVLTNERAQTYGFDILHCVSGAQVPQVDINPEGWNIIRHALPIKVKQIVVAQAYDPWKGALLDFVSYQITRRAAFKSRLDPDRIQGTSVKSVIHQLEVKGIRQPCIPRSLGGSYDYSVFADWTRMRLSLEDIMSSAPVAPRITFDFTPSLEQTEASVLAHHRHRITKAPDRSVRDTHLQRPRIAMNNSQSSYPGALELVQRRTELEHQNQALREENQRLESFLALARMILHS